MSLCILLRSCVYFLHKLLYCIGIDAVIGSINCTPLEGVVLTATRPPVVIKPKPIIFTNDVTISNLSADKCSTKALHKYFSNKKKSGINTYKAIKIINKTTAVLQLKDESGKNVLTFTFSTIVHNVTNKCYNITGAFSYS